VGEGERVSRPLAWHVGGPCARSIAPTPRPRTGCADRELLRRRDLDVVAWVAEQYAARVDQLEILLGAGPRTVQRTLARLREHGLVTTRRLLAGEPVWVLPTAAGLRASGSSFCVWQPRVGLLAHVAAVNDVRLHIQRRSPGSQWIAERTLARDRQASEHLPDAVVLADGQLVAIEVELTVKSQRRVTTILDGLASRFDAVVYFCSPGPHRQLTELADTGRWPTLGVRQLPQQQDA
jgi:DNA-binding transcriptional ArsR family regulator